MATRDDPRDVVEIVAFLADPLTRRAGAKTVADWLGADNLVVFVLDIVVDVLLPAPGFVPTTLPGGPSWPALLERCRVPGTHRTRVTSLESDGAEIDAIACSRGDVAAVALGAGVAPGRVAQLARLLPLLGAMLRAEQLASIAQGEVRAARDSARDSAALAVALDKARKELRRQTEQTAEAMRAKDEFLAMLGHELRNPLAPISTALELMRMRGFTSRELDVIERQVGQMTGLVDDLLDVARIARGRIELRRTRVELATVIARALEIVGPLVDRKKQRIVLDVEPGLMLDADPQRLAQVFSNLLTNAAKYSDAGRCIGIVTERRGERVVVRVIDEGLGIEPAMRESIFELFVQRAQSLDRAQGGLGLGLAIVRSLVALHGGTVCVDSEGLGRGSRFVVELPLCSSESANPAVELPHWTKVRPDEVPEYRRVLVVDDNEDAAEMLGEILVAWGHDVRIAADGPSALRVVEGWTPDAALLDIGLPVMDGYDLAARLRAASQCRALRLVAVTGYGRAADVERSRAAGFDGHLVKPIDLDELRRLLVGNAG